MSPLTKGTQRNKCIWKLKIIHRVRGIRDFWWIRKKVWELINESAYNQFGRLRWELIAIDWILSLNHRCFEWFQVRKFTQIKPQKFTSAQLEVVSWILQATLKPCIQSVGQKYVFTETLFGLWCVVQNDWTHVRKIDCSVSRTHIRRMHRKAKRFQKVIPNRNGNAIIEARMMKHRTKEQMNAFQQWQIKISCISNIYFSRTTAFFVFVFVLLPFRISFGWGLMRDIIISTR